MKMSKLFGKKEWIKSYDENSYDENSYDENSYDENSYDENSYDEHSHDENSYDQNSYDENSYGKKKLVFVFFIIKKTIIEKIMLVNHITQFDKMFCLCFFLIVLDRWYDELILLHVSDKL